MILSCNSHEFYTSKYGVRFISTQKCALLQTKLSKLRLNWRMGAGSDTNMGNLLHFSFKPSHIITPLLRSPLTASSQGTTRTSRTTTTTPWGNPSSSTPTTTWRWRAGCGRCWTIKASCGCIRGRQTADTKRHRKPADGPRLLASVCAFLSLLPGVNGEEGVLSAFKKAGYKHPVYLLKPRDKFSV